MATREWNGRRFVIVDTGGLELDPDDPIEARVQEQARLAIAEADVILFIVDAISGLTPADLEAADILRRAKAPVIVAVNKADNEKRELEGAEFHSLGWEETYTISASHGRGTGDLLDAIVWALPPETEAELARKAREAEAESWAERGRRRSPRAVRRRRPGGSTRTTMGTADATDDAEARRWDAAMAADADGEPAAIAFVGRPNVGKSSLLNALLGEERAIVSEVPGTTRDAIDTRLAWGRSEVVLIDTAGIRRRGKVAGGPAAERYSTLRALHALSRADVAVLVIDAVEGLTSQDAHVAGLRRRGRQGPRHRGQQVGPRRRQDGPDLRPVHRMDPQRGAVPRLRPDRLDQRQDRPARRARARDGHRHLGRTAQADLDRRAQPGA